MTVKIEINVELAADGVRNVFNSYNQKVPFTTNIPFNFIFN